LNSAEILLTDGYNYFGRMKENGNQTHTVGSKVPNKFGLYDMHGNVWEWCADWYHPNYEGVPTDGSAYTTVNEHDWRVVRGGSFFYYPAYLRSAARFWGETKSRDPSTGFRVVAVART
jgi:formylglycine-generating enzyme required for sulfatase activity